MWQHYFPFIQKLRRALAAMQLALCSSCFRRHHQVLSREHPILQGRGSSGQYNHATGLVLKRLEESGPVSAEAVQKWFDDRDHGLFHGICTALAGAMCEPQRLTSTEALVCQVKEKEPWTTNYFLSAVLHDFCRGGLGIEAGHDAALEKLFPGLLPETYSHSSPSPAFENEPLIIGDRLELLRFADYATWVDDTRLEAARNKFKTPNVNIFYKCIRPALSLLYFYGDEIWLRHGLESRAIHVKLPDTDWTKGYFPQAGSFVNVRDAVTFMSLVEHGFSVEIGRGCLAHCMQHGDQWLNVVGVIPVKRYVEQGGAIRRCNTTKAPHGTFQHLCGVGAIPQSEWLFHYREKPRNAYWDCLRPMVANGAMVLPTDVVATWQQVVAQWKERIELMLLYARKPEVSR